MCLSFSRRLGIFFFFITLDQVLKRPLGLELSNHTLTAVQRFRGGLVFETHRLLYHSTLGLRVIKKKRRLLSSLHPPLVACG